MIKRLQKSIVLSMVVFFVFSMFGSIGAFANINIPKQSPEFYINDTADVLTSEQEAEIITTAKQFYEKNNQAQIVVVTVKSLDGSDVKTYARALYNEYGVGKNSMGILILLSLGKGKGDRDIRIETGHNMQNYLTDAKAGELIRSYGMPHFQNEEIAAGLVSLQKATADYVTEVLSKQSAVAVETPKTSSDFSINWSIIFFIIGLIVFLCGIAYLIYRIYIEAMKKKDLIKLLNRQLSDKKREIRNLNQIISEKNNSISKLCEEKSKLNEEVNDKQVKIEKLEDWKCRAKQIFPNAENAIEEMKKREYIAENKKVALVVDEMLKKAQYYPADKKNVSIFKDAIDAYNKLTKDQVQYIASDVKAVKEKYQSSYKLLQEHETKVRIEKAKKKANQVEKLIASGISGVTLWNAMRNLSRLKNLKNEYDYLSTEEKSYIDSSVIRELENLISKGKRDKEEEERREREEERRRQEAAMFSSSFDSSSDDSGSSISDCGFDGSFSDGGGADCSF